MEKELRSLLEAVEVRKSDGSPTKIAGYAVRWGQLSSPIAGFFKEKFERGAFTKTLAERGNDIYAAWNHDSSQILGRAPTTLKLEEDEVGLRYEITPPSWADKHLETIERGDVRGSSFIFRAVKQTWDETDPNMDIRTVSEADLFEVSPVTTPAYPTSSVGIRSAEAVHEEYKQGKQARKDEPNADLELRQKQRQRELDLLGRV